MTVVGLVVEGTNDYPIISRFIEACLHERFVRPIRFLHLQPEPDATSGNYRGGGWSRVLGWCKANSNGRIETYFNPLEEEDVVCDLIVVHLDGDALDPCAPHYSKVIPASPCSPTDRVITLTGMIQEWLELPAQRRDQVRGAFPVLHSEAWLLSALRPDEADWENELDCKAPFKRLNNSRRKPSEFYDSMSITAAGLFEDVRRQSISFSFFANELRR